MMSNIGNKETFAKNLKYYMDKTGRTQKEMSEVVGVAPSSFNDWMKAKKYPRIDKIEILSNYFGINMSDLIEEKINPAEQGMFEARILKDKELMDMVKMYLKLDEKNKRAVRQMVEALSAD